ncbi:MAG TPA: IPT/TIG domain-containing protein [Candidatus Hydrogenedens sp.]|nr:IPT/TIG domain-containing protein [Candidatus Hydrogenedens sp.]
MSINKNIIFILIKIVLLLPIVVEAENIFLLSATKTNLNETVRLCGEVFCPDSEQVFKSRSMSVIPGNRIVDYFSANNNNDVFTVLFTATIPEVDGKIQDEGIYYTVFGKDGRVKDVRFLITQSNWEIVKILPCKKPGIDFPHYAIFEKKETGNLSLGRALFFTFDNDNFLQTPQIEVPLPFAADKVCPLNENGMWVAVKSNLFRPPQFCIVDEYLKMSRTLLINDLEKECTITDILPFQDDYLIIIASSALGELQKGRNSEVYVFDMKIMSITTEPMSLFGEGTIKEDNVYPTNKGFWIKTTSMEEGFGYLVYAIWDSVNGWEKKLEYSFSEIEQDWQTAIHPSKEIMAVAYSNRIEIVGEPLQKSWIEKLEERITYLEWYSDTSLLVGSAGKLYRLDLNKKTVEKWFHTNSGWVFNAFPDLLDYPCNSDINMNKEMFVEEVQFQGERAGKDVQGLLLGKSHPAIIDWDVSFVGEPAEWLIWYRDKHLDNDLLYLGLLPYSWVENSISVWLRVDPIVNNELVDNIIMPSGKYIRARVIKNIKDPRRILFVWAQTITESFRSEKDPRELKHFGDLLAETPFYFSMEEISEPIGGNDLSYYGIVIVEARAIAMGIVSVKDLLDYISGGGNVLMLGDYWREGDPTLFNYWLSPIGISYDPKQRVDGVIPIDTETMINSNVKEIPIIGGGTLKSVSKTNATSNPANQNTSPTIKQVSFIARDYDYGKISILSARTPLSSAKLSDPVNKTFAMQLFQWLSYSRTQYIDTDGDGLQDMLEDRNRNGIVDEGETNPYVKDSDEDGIPDGKEDRNRNGLWDEDETDPTCPDSNGDSIWDGADIYPTPTFGKQVITRINPAEAAAEGGSLVFVQGRNFTNDTQFWFGSRRSPSIRILSPEFAIVIVPEFHLDNGGEISVYAAKARERIKSVPGKPFLYTQRSQVKVKISNILQTENLNVDTIPLLQFQIMPPAKGGTFKEINFLLRIKGQISPEIRVDDTNKWRVNINHIRDEWYLLIAEWQKVGPAYGSFVFELVGRLSGETKEPQEITIPEVVKVWAETAYHGRLTVKLEK